MTRPTYWGGACALVWRSAPSIRSSRRRRRRRGGERDGSCFILTPVNLSPRCRDLTATRSLAQWTWIHSRWERRLVECFSWVFILCEAQTERDNTATETCLVGCWVWFGLNVSWLRNVTVLWNYDTFQSNSRLLKLKWTMEKCVFSAVRGLKTHLPRWTEALTGACLVCSHQLRLAINRNR